MSIWSGEDHDIAPLERFQKSYPLAQCLGFVMNSRILLQGVDPPPAVEMHGPVKKDPRITGIEFVGSPKIRSGDLAHGLAFRDSRQPPPGQSKTLIQFRRSLKFVFRAGKIAAAEQDLTGKFMSGGRFRRFGEGSLRQRPRHGDPLVEKRLAAESQ